MPSPFAGMNPYLEHPELFPGLQSIIPSFSLPLRSGDTEPVIDLQALLNGVYDIYDYDLVVDYSQEAVPPLSKADAVWVNELLQEKGLR